MKIGKYEITLDNIGVWPRFVKVTAYVLVALITFNLTYWIDIHSKVAELEAEQKKEQELKLDLETKYNTAANLLAYKQQLRSIQELFANLLQQLPTSDQMHDLLNDISDASKMAGLKLISLVPQQEQRHGFYAIVPIQIVAQGSYHQFGDFVSKLADLNRIVVADTYTIKFVKKDAVPDAGSSEQLEMSMQINTYRYLDTNDDSQTTKPVTVKK